MAAGKATSHKGNVAHVPGPWRRSGCLPAERVPKRPDAQRRFAPRESRLGSPPILRRGAWSMPATGVRGKRPALSRCQVGCGRDTVADSAGPCPGGSGKRSLRSLPMACSNRQDHRQTSLPRPPGVEGGLFLVSRAPAARTYPGGAATGFRPHPPSGRTDGQMVSVFLEHGSALLIMFLAQSGKSQGSGDGVPASRSLPHLQAR